MIAKSIWMGALQESAGVPLSEGIIVVIIALPTV